MSSLNISFVGPGGRACGTPPNRYPVLPTMVNECPDRFPGTWSGKPVPEEKKTKAFFSSAYEFNSIEALATRSVWIATSL